MQLLLFIILYPLLWLISILPFRLLYIFSDGIYFLVYQIIGYRKKVVRQNIALALPHLSEEERTQIEKKFYSHMCDMFLEMIKTMNITQKEIDERFKFTNLATYQNLEKQGKSIALMCAHYASYEWVLSMNKHISFKGYGIYKQIANKYFDKLVRNIRSRFKAYLITTKQSKSTIEKNKKDGILGVYGFASDQTPRWSKLLYWHHFMGIETPIHTGAEKLAKKYNMNVIFLRTKKIKRGYYEASFEVMTEDIHTIPNYKLSEDFMARVEQQIHEQPEYYLWTHKRWKHKKKD
ncbi:lysophospholipid acyltransferase family protein [Flavobacterium aquatile]|uniref:Lipid A biosynthesis acyltransferase n=1 Tax=Flavobacterium aquatile LMG 4008 = ATCC 11947 TaxID=1453498 RepID=A0A095V1A5_9FLAO|nr:lipid A biosynthesis acyltransferase [Flavobacterium aquatile]KGD68610.1 lipid A biosynthesis acyltransferase [Flavobacterium aquatile LMG 4008 = ATCC 11947]OXA68461.1 lipid A biosynthesis acyltransferase [Flavobacterium aquatile LMG 4008 = ATCC 11947]GEC79737.1 lipid A biosynthesis protein [Flavobacterium aquatile]